MSWDYRLVHQFGTNNSEETWHLFTIHEVYYDEYGEPDRMTKDEVSPSGNNYSEFLKSWEFYQKAIDKEVLHFDRDNNRFEPNYRKHNKK